jgi:hypothetical protein
VGVQRYIENLVTPLKNTNNSFEFNIITFKQTGDSLRRIAVEMTIHDPFKQARIKEITRVSDVDTLHFKYKPVNPNAIAVVIGNTDYGQNAPMRDFGVNDAISVKNYLVGLCGYKDGNINLKTDVTLNVMRTIFGTEDSPEGWLADHSNENTDVFIYFSGHGAPGVKNNKCYLMPVDCNPNYAQSSGYSLDLLYKNLSLIKAKNVFIVIDACFSAQILQGVSPIHTKPIDPVNNIPNGISITASESYAMDFPEKMHTMLTYFFLKAMKDSYTTDISPKNGKVSIQEIFNYISNGNSGVPYESRRISKSLVTQKPVMKGTGDKERVFVVK